MRTIPKDPIMCLSFVNTKLRDSYSSLDDFCEDFEADRVELVSKLAQAGYTYDREKNQFR